MKVFLGNQLLPASGAHLDITDRGLTLGDGVFETIAVRAGRAARFDAHLQRLHAGAEVIGLVVPLNNNTLADAVEAVIEANAINEGVLRLTLTGGPAPRGLLPPETAHPTLLITGASQDLDPAPPATAVIALETRRNEMSPLCGIKTTGFLNGILAAREASRRGADEALLLNTKGDLAEATIANLFLVIDGTAVTPRTEDGALPGVMRADVIKELGAMERTLSPDDLANASEAFLTNALGVKPLVMVDGAAVGDGKPGPVTATAQEVV